MLTAVEAPVLVVRSGPKSGNIIRVRNRLQIGRHPKNRLSIGDPSLSRWHASIEVTERGTYVVDQKSRNGTFVNGRRVVNRSWVNPGDTIKVGETEIAVEAP